MVGASELICDKLTAAPPAENGKYVDARNHAWVICVCCGWGCMSAFWRRCLHTLSSISRSADLFSKVEALGCWTAAYSPQLDFLVEEIGRGSPSIPKREV